MNTCYRIVVAFLVAALLMGAVAVPASAGPLRTKGVVVAIGDPGRVPGLRSICRSAILTIGEVTYRGKVTYGGVNKCRIAFKHIPADSGLATITILGAKSVVTGQKEIYVGSILPYPVTYWYAGVIPLQWPSSVRP